MARMAVYTSRSASASGCNCPSPSWMIPTVEVKPSSSARLPTVSASCGLRMPPPTTELMLTWKSACSARSCSFLSSTFRLFFETSSGITLSIEICRWSSPARFSRWMRSAVSR